MPSKKGTRRGLKSQDSNKSNETLENSSEEVSKRRNRNKIDKSDSNSFTTVNGETNRSYARRVRKIINVSKDKRELILNSIVQKNNELECNFCNFVAASIFHLKVHMELKHTDNSNFVACSMCNFTANSHRTLDIHVHTEHQKSRWKCRKCDDLPFKNPEQLLNHINTKHKDSPLQS